MDTSKSRSGSLKPLALMWRGNTKAPDQPTNHPERFKALFAEIERLGVETRQVVYFDRDAKTVRDQLKAMSGVLVWINPLQDGQDRTTVDAMLREVSAAGVWVSAHPDTILKMGTKEVLYATRELGWGSDTDLYSTFDDFALRFPVKLAAAGPRVLKALRGNDGRSVFKVETIGKARLRLQEAINDQIEMLPLASFIARSKETFSGLIDQAFQDNVKAGMVRVYMSQNRVAGFSEQAPRNLAPTPEQPAFGMNSAKTMHSADAAKFADLRNEMENDWTPGLQAVLGIETDRLPALWDADFMWRPPGHIERSRYVLCEINVSSVSPFPPSAVEPVAATVLRAISARQ